MVHYAQRGKRVSMVPPPIYPRGSAAPANLQLAGESSLLGIYTRTSRELSSSGSPGAFRPQLLPLGAYIPTMWAVVTKEPAKIYPRTGQLGLARIICLLLSTLGFSASLRVSALSGSLSTVTPLLLADPRAVVQAYR